MSNHLTPQQMERIRQLYVAVDPNTGKPAYTQKQIAQLVSVEFSSQLSRSVVAKWVQRNSAWTTQRSSRVDEVARAVNRAASKVAKALGGDAGSTRTTDAPGDDAETQPVQKEPATSRQQVVRHDDAVDDVDVLVFAKEYTRMLSQLSTQAAYGLGQMLNRHLASWKILEQWRKGEVVLDDDQLALQRAALMKSSELMRVMGLGSTFASNNILQVFIQKFEQTVEQTNFFGWVGDDEALPPPPRLASVDPHRPPIEVRADEAHLDEPPMAEDEP